MRIRAFVLAAALTTASFVSADDLVWTPLGPFEGAAILAIGADPHMPGTLYASVDRQGLFKSTDYGLTWRRTDAGLSDAESVISIAFDNAGAVWAAEDSGVFKSLNGGATWTSARLPTDYGEEYADLHVTAVAPDPNVPALVYAHVFLSFANSIWPTHVVKSTDGGADWSVLPVRSYFTGGCGLYVDRFSSAVHADFYVSYDFGESWTTETVPRCGAIAEHPSDPSILYRGTFEGVQRSLDGGTTWIPVNEGLTDRGVAALVVDPFEPTQVYAATSSGIFTRTFPARQDLMLTLRSRPAPQRIPDRP